MANKIRKKRRRMRKRQRENRQKLNQRMKDQGKGFLARRKVIRKNRKADRNKRKSVAHLSKAQERRSELSRSHRAQARRGGGGGGGGGGGAVTMPAPPPGVREPLFDMDGAAVNQGWTPGQGRRRPLAGRRPLPGRRPMPPRGGLYPPRMAPQQAPMPAWDMQPAYPPFDPYAAMPPIPPIPGPMPLPPIPGPVPAMDPWAMDPWAMDPWGMPMMVDPAADYWDDELEWMQTDPLFAPDAWDPTGVDPYDDAILIDVDDHDIVPIGDEELWDEFDEDVFDVAGEIAGDLSALATSGAVGDANTEIRDLEGLIEQLGNTKIKSLKLIAEMDGWNPAALERDAQVIADAVEAVQDAMDEAAAEGAIAGVEFGAGGLTAALASIPLLASAVPRLLDAREDADARQDGRRGRRRRRRDQREADRDRELAELQAVADKHRSGTLDLSDADGAGWGMSARAGDVIVRAKLGKRAAIANAGNGFYIVREVPEGLSTDTIKAQMAAALDSFDPTVVSGEIGCANCNGQCMPRR